MSNPPEFSDPDRTGSALYTADSGESDGGGVHTNSGVGNKAASLMVDGGTFNGKTVAALGIATTAKIHYRALTTLLRSGSDYPDLAQALVQACTELVGTDGIGVADCTQVSQAVAAVEMPTTPALAPAPQALMCPSGSASIVWGDDMENSSSGRWTSQSILGTPRFFYSQDANPFAFNAHYARSGTNNQWGYAQGARSNTARAMTESVTVTAGMRLHFAHAYGFEDDASKAYDGGLLEYSLDGGVTWQDAAALIEQNGYTGTISADAGSPATQAPDAGSAAFVRESNGYISTRVDLSSLEGSAVRFRFRISTDSGGDDYGWFIDDVNFYTCPAGGDMTPPETTVSLAPPALTNANSISLGFLANEPATFECRLDAAAFAACSTPVTYTDVSEGEHVIQVRATDTAGNTDPSPALARFTVDRTAPDTRITQAPPAEGTSMTVTTHFDASEAGAVFACALDGAAFATCVSPVSANALAAGAHHILVRACDAAGNCDATPARADFVVRTTSSDEASPPVIAPADVTPPDTRITALIVRGRTARARFASEAGARFECARDRGAFRACASPLRWTRLSRGVHRLRVRARDAAGNVDPTPAVRRFRVPPLTAARR